MRNALPRHTHPLEKTPTPTAQPHKKYINPAIRPQNSNKNQQNDLKEATSTAHRPTNTNTNIKRKIKEIKIKFTIIPIVKIQTLIN